MGERIDSDKIAKIVGHPLTDERENPPDPGGSITRREFLGLIGLFLAIASPAVVLPALSFLREYASRRSNELIGAANEKKYKPSFPFPSGSHESLSISTGQNVEVIKPDVLRQAYGIEIIPWTIERKPDFFLFIRPNEALFRKVFGFLYDMDGLDPHILRKRLEIVVVNDDVLCHVDLKGKIIKTNVDQDVSATLYQKWQKFKETLEKHRFPTIPEIKLFVDFVGSVTIGGEHQTLDDNLKSLEATQKKLSTGISERSYFFGACSDPIGGRAISYPQFLGDDKGEVMQMPSQYKSAKYVGGHVPPVELVGRIYIPLKTQPEQLGPYQFNPAGIYAVHETRHIQAFFDPKGGFALPISEHEELAYAAGKEYGRTALARFREANDTSGFLFIIRTRPFGDSIG